MKKLIHTLLLLLTAGTAFAQSGWITGRISTKDGRTVADAKIIAIGRTDTATSDLEGKFYFKLPVGKYLIYAEQDQFGNFSDSATIVDGKETYFNVVLDNEKKIGNIDIRVARKPKGGTVDWGIQAQRINPGVSSNVTSADLAKTPISTAAGALTRIPGATIMEGKFANIRGMFDRYNSGYLNGAPLPSTETDRKAFSFDIIPSSLLDNIEVIKSGTPDLIGDFGGGIIRINTKSIPDKLTQSFNLGFQYNSITSFRDIQEFPTSTSEYFGIPSAARKLPNLSGELTSNKSTEFLANETHKFNNDWSLTSKQPMLAPRFNYSLGVPFKLKNKQEIGLLVSLNYSLTQKYSDGNVNRNDLGDNRTLSTFTDQLYTSTVQNGGIVNVSYKFNRSRIDWRNLYSLNYGSSSTIRKGLASADDGLSIEGYSNMVTSNRLMSSQVNGTHILGKRQATLTWMLNYGNTRREVPDFRIAQYGILDGTRTISLNDFFNAGSGRFFSNLGETSKNGSVDMRHNLQTGKLLTKIKYGAFYQQRVRTFTSRNFVYGPLTQQIESKNMPEQDFGSNNISANHLYLVEKTSIDKDDYNGESNLYAGYAMLEHNYPVFKSKSKDGSQDIKVIYGLRVERFSQILRNAYFDKYLGRYLSNPGTTNDILPSVNINTPITKKTNLRLSYYKTVNRPEMRELAPFAFYNFNLNSEILGNTQLKRAQLNNYDIRYEMYPKKGDAISIGAFAKKINSPIEFSLDVTQPAIRTFNYQNGKSAEIYGAELEIRKNLGFISKTALKGFFNNLSLYSNFSLIKSKVQFSGKTTSVQNRPLQGQSPYVANVSLFYENEKTGFQFSTTYNKIGSRIAYIGVAKDVQTYGGDIYEFGRGILDFQIGKSFKKAGTIKLTCGDILHQNTVYYQDLNNNKKYDAKGDNTLFKFTNGSTVTISYGYTF